jgi:hypothetical protein
MARFSAFAVILFRAPWTRGLPGAGGFLRGQILTLRGAMATGGEIQRDMRRDSSPRRW